MRGLFLAAMAHAGHLGHGIHPRPFPLVGSLGYQPAALAGNAGGTFDSTHDFCNQRIERRAQKRLSSFFQSAAALLAGARFWIDSRHGIFELFARLAGPGSRHFVAVVRVQSWFGNRASADRRYRAGDFVAGAALSQNRAARMESLRLRRGGGRVDHAPGATLS